VPGGRALDEVFVALLVLGVAANDHCDQGQQRRNGQIDRRADPAASFLPTTLALYPVGPYLAQQVEELSVQHGRTSGEAEWAMVLAGPGPSDVLIIAS
jgi:hypothetical protein